MDFRILAPPDTLTIPVGCEEELHGLQTFLFGHGFEVGDTSATATDSRQGQAAIAQLRAVLAEGGVDGLRAVFRGAVETLRDWQQDPQG
jgi:hypothetical protein